MKKIYIVVTLLFFSLCSWGFELPKEWIQANLPAPTLFAANQYKGDAIINSINVFALEGQLAAVTGLKKKIKDNDLKSIGDGYVVTNFKPLSELKDAYQIDAKNLRTEKSFTQIWKFGEKKTFVAQVTNFSKLDKEIKKEIFKMLEGQ